jgi:hypothetical protein
MPRDRGRRAKADRQYGPKAYDNRYDMTSSFPVLVAMGQDVDDKPPPRADGEPSTPTANKPPV